MKTYQGSCHCGDVRYEVQGDFKEGLRCNCSICSRAGWVLLFVEEASFTLKQGKDKLSDYQFGKKHIHHPFCTKCGVRSFGYGKTDDGSTTYSINANCLEGFSIDSLDINSYDGAAL